MQLCAQVLIIWTISGSGSDSALPADNYGSSATPGDRRESDIVMRCTGRQWSARNSAAGRSIERVTNPLNEIHFPCHLSSTVGRVLYVRGVAGSNSGKVKYIFPI